MNKNILSKCISVVVLLSAIGSFANDHKPQPFSADFTLISPRGQEITAGKLYLAWPKLRLDAKDVQTGFTTFVIIDYVAQKAISLVPQYQTYIEISLDQQNQTTKSNPPIGPTFDASNPCAGHDSWSCKKVANQTTADRSCDVWEILTDEHGSFTVWIDTKLGFPIKSKSADGYILEYTNIQEGQQPAPTLFQVPPGYKKSAAHSEPTSGR